MVTMGYVINKSARPANDCDDARTQLQQSGSSADCQVAAFESRKNPLWPIRIDGQRLGVNGYRVPGVAWIHAGKRELWEQVQNRQGRLSAGFLFQSMRNFGAGLQLLFLLFAPQEREFRFTSGPQRQITTSGRTQRPVTVFYWWSFASFSPPDFSQVVSRVPANRTQAKW